MRMKFHICLFLVSFSAIDSYGDSDTLYYNEDPISFDGADFNNAFYNFDNSLQSFNKGRKESYDDTTPNLYTENWNKFLPKMSGAFYLQKSNPLNRRKRALYDGPTEDDGHKHSGVEELSPFPQHTSHGLEEVKTIHFPHLFTPRFGRKRSALQATDILETGDTSGDSYVPADNTSPRLSMSERAAMFHFNSGKGFTSRLGKFKSRATPEISFASRLGRSSAQNLVQLSAGSAFTPRLGRSVGYNPVQLTAGSAFTPRLGRSDGYNPVQLTAGSAFTPRLGRSEGYNPVQLTAGSAFSPRLGRSEAHNPVQLTAGSAFTPRLGRSEGYNPVRINTGNMFTPKLGRLVSRNQIHLNAGSAFTPRLGRSKDFERIRINSLNPSGEFINIGRSEISRNPNIENAFTPTLKTSENPNTIS